MYPPEANLGGYSYIRQEQTVTDTSQQDRGVSDGRSGPWLAGGQASGHRPDDLQARGRRQHDGRRDNHPDPGRAAVWRLLDQQGAAATSLIHWLYELSDEPTKVRHQAR